MFFVIKYQVNQAFKLPWFCWLFFLFGCSPSNKAVEIRSEPTAARIYIEDKFIGFTPIKTELAVGRHAIKVDKNGFFPYLSNCHITSNASFSFVLDKLRGTIVIAYNVKPDLLFLNGRSVNPNREIKSPAQPIKVLAYKKNYPLIEKSLTVETDKRNRLKIDFSKTSLGASLYIDSTPPQAKVLLYGMKLAETPVTFNHLSAGIYKWQLKKEGYKSEFLYVNLKKKDKRSFKVNLTQNRVELKINPPREGQIGIYRENKNFPILFDDIDTNGFASRLLSGVYLIEYRPRVGPDQAKPMFKKVHLYEDTVVTFPNKKAIKIVETKWEKEIGFSNLLFMVAGRKKVYFVDAEKGVYDERGRNYLPPVFMSDWKNCLLIGSDLYLSDSFNIYRGSVAAKGQWQEVYQSHTGFINGIYPLGDGLLISVGEEGNWNFFSLGEREIKTAASPLSLDELKNISERDVLHRTFGYEAGTLYLLAQKSQDLIAIAPGKINEISMGKPTGAKIDAMGQAYRFLQVQGDLYLWSQSTTSLHLYNQAGVFLHSFKLSLPGVVKAFVLRGEKLYFAVKNEVFFFEMVEGE